MSQHVLAEVVGPSCANIRRLSEARSHVEVPGAGLPIGLGSADVGFASKSGAGYTEFRQRLSSAPQQDQISITFAQFQPLLGRVRPNQGAGLGES